ncbi:MAG: PilZ domain-containing protein [Spirochaetaceae bacterium]|nr:PilZ domain-containing protein [Spirochaetaceae bacterium]
MNIFILQSLREFKITSNPVTAAVTFGIFGCIAAGFIYLNASQKVQNSNAVRTGKVDISKVLPRVSAAFMRICREYGLSHTEAAFLEYLFKIADIRPTEAFRAKDKINENFAAAYRVLKRENQDENADLKNTMSFFSIRNAVEYKNSLAIASRGSKNHLPRKYIRKESGAECVFYPVITTKVKNGLKTVIKLTVNNEKHKGILLNVSCGGCALSTSENIKPGGKMKLEFKAGRASVAALGNVLRVNKNTQGSVLHIQFLKVPARSMTALNAYIYGYND